MPSKSLQKSTVPSPRFLEGANLPATAQLAQSSDKSSQSISSSNNSLEDNEKTKSHWYVGSIDCGTTSSRFLIFGRDGNPVASHQIELNNIHTNPGWHEHDPLELVSTVVACIEEATSKFIKQGHSENQIKSIGITNQRETTICWDTKTGEPLYNAIVWSDIRTRTIVRELKRKTGSAELLQLCGLPISTYPSSIKLLWLIRNIKSVTDAYEEGRLSFGTVDSWLIYKLNGGEQAGVHVTDPTNASRTMFMNIHSFQYDEKLLDFFEISRKNVALPKIVPSSDKIAYGKLASGTLRGTKITGCLGDQSAALVGQGGFSPGQAKNTYGTGCFLLYNVGEKPVISNSGLLATVAYDFGHKYKPVYALEGSVAVAGSGVKFLKDNMGFVSHSSMISELARSVKDNGGIVFVTAFSGLFAPYWIDDARGTIFGITAHTQRGHIARATLEATCFQTKAILDAMEKDSGYKFESLSVDGGLSNSDLCMQIQADIIQIPVDRPMMRETTALGAAIAAGLAIHMWQDLDELREINEEGRDIFTPQLDIQTCTNMVRKWEHAVQMSRGWDREVEEIN
ncbi:Glycerol kinase [Golovinomyces cichoracearum]|uniref:glycerol kinase n=1 Tax=Golovinomyces cichoracearum TaxID=62708 RepID=A0A420HH39_9PEZI|nr:Glycerol kinase [Golovinomyces cichoracearum]